MVDRVGVVEIRRRAPRDCRQAAARLRRTAAPRAAAAASPQQRRRRQARRRPARVRTRARISKARAAARAHGRARSSAQAGGKVRGCRRGRGDVLDGRDARGRPLGRGGGYRAVVDRFQHRRRMRAARPRPSRRASGPRGAGDPAHRGRSECRRRQALLAGELHGYAAGQDAGLHRRGQRQEPASAWSQAAAMDLACMASETTTQVLATRAFWLWARTSPTCSQAASM